MPGLPPLGIDRDEDEEVVLWPRPESEDGDPSEDGDLSEEGGPGPS